MRDPQDSRAVEFRKPDSWGTDFHRMKEKGRGAGHLIGATDSV